MSQTEQRLNFRVVKPLIRRCRWCQLNTANKMERYWVREEWTFILSPKHYFGEDVDYSDGICDECSAKMREQIAARKVK